MRYRLIFLFSLFLNIGYAQNLVKNPSFEEYHLELTETDFKKNKDYFICKDWFIPNYSSVDYLNHTRSNICRTKNDSIVLSQSPSHGDACVGLILLGGTGYLEQIMGSLSSPLQKDSLYKINFKLRFIGEVSFYLTKLIGMKFSSNRILYPHLDEFFISYDEMFKETKLKSDIEFNIINSFDTTMWVEYEGIYKAGGGEQFFTFGLFYQEDTQFNRSIKKLQQKRTMGLKQEYRFYKRRLPKRIVEVNPRLIFDQVSTKFHGTSSYLIDEVAIVPVK